MMTAVIGLINSSTDVRGLCGDSAWMARITGLDRTYDFRREFCRKDRTELAESGVIWFEMRGPGLYEFREFCVAKRTPRGTRNQKWGGFVLISADGNVEEVDRDRALELAKQLA